MLRTTKGKCVPLDNANLAGLLRLLDEPETSGLEPLLDQVAQLPEDELTALALRARESTPDIRRNLALALDRSVFLRHQAHWQRVIARRNLDLEAALLVISRACANPAVRGVDVGAALDELADRVGARLSGDRAFDNGLEILGAVLRERGLRGNVGDYYAPGNSCIQQVLTSGFGIPISLCSVAILVGRRLELPVHGIGSPGHFLGFYGDPDLQLGSFFDPYEGFRRLTMGSIVRLVGQYLPQPIDPKVLKPTTDHDIVCRTLRNLIGCYTATAETEKVRNLEQWLHEAEAGAEVSGGQS